MAAPTPYCPEIEVDLSRFDLELTLESGPDINVDVLQTDLVIEALTVANQGPKGDQGPPGPVGPAGPIGPQGPLGLQGQQGIQGNPGQGLLIKGTVPTSANLPPTGSPGDCWVANDTGHGWSWDGTKWVDIGPIQGPQGIPGDPGATGATGATGPAGAAGAKGDKGDTGATGTPGATGTTGPQGATGAPGPTGPQGATGAQGVKGDPGAQGPIGNTGPQGIQGTTGATGPQGTQGVQGVAGATGAKGDKGDLGSEDVGSVKPWPAAGPPASWMLANGAAVSRTLYPDLFAVLGTTWGAGDGSTTFNLPDLRGRFLLPAGQGSGLTNRVLAASGGEEAHALNANENASHTHTATQAAHSHAVNIPQSGATAGASLFPNYSGGTAGGIQSGSATPAITVGSSGAGLAHENMPPFLVITYIIKVSPTGGATAQAPIADATQAGLLRKVSGLSTDYVGGDNACHPGIRFVSKTSSTILTAADANSYVLCSGGSWPLYLPVPQAGYCFMVRNDQNCFGTTGTITITMTGGTINGLASLPLLPQQECQIFCDGTNWRTFGLRREVILGTLDITSSTANGVILLPVGFRYFELNWTGVVTATDAATFLGRLSSDGGATWIAAAYDDGLIWSNAATTVIYSNVNSQTSMRLSCGMTTAYTGQIRTVLYPGSTTRHPSWLSDSEGWRNSDNITGTFRAQGFLNNTILANALQYFCSAGNIANAFLTIKGVV